MTKNVCPISLDGLSQLFRVKIHSMSLAKNMYMLSAGMPDVGL